MMRICHKNRQVLQSTLRRATAAAAVLFCFCLIPGWSPLFPDDRGIGGTGIEGGGIGGTGAPTTLTDRGIGGTGIVGTITGFGSIFVNGLEVHYTDGLPVNSIDGVIAPNNFAVGQVVAVEAEQRNGRLFANTAEIKHPVAGRISDVDAQTGRVKVFDQWVDLSNDTRFHDTTNQTTNLQPGDYITVSGFQRPDGTIDATRIERRKDGPGSVTGNITAIDDRGFTVGNVRVDSPIGTRTQNIKVGDQITVTGAATATTLQATRLTPRSSKPFGGRMRRLSLEGYAKPGPAGIGLSLRGINVDPSTIPAGSDISNRRVVVGGETAPGEALRIQRLEQIAPRNVIPLERLRQQTAPPGRNVPLQRDRTLNRPGGNDPNATQGTLPQRPTPRALEQRLDRPAHRPARRHFERNRPPRLRRPAQPRIDRPAPRRAPRRPPPRRHRR